jgi:DNA-binding Lrp family transcriptional regulator
MQPLNPTDIAVLDFLTRNFAELTSMRQIAQQLGLSTAGVHKSLKGFEQEKLVIPERLGSGIFYRMNFAGKASHHLACLCVLSASPSLDLDTQAGHDIKAVFADKKEKEKFTIIAFDEAKAKDILRNKLGTKSSSDTSVLSPENFVSQLVAREKKLLALIKSSDVIYGEDFVVNALRRGAVRL